MSFIKKPIDASSGTLKIAERYVIYGSLALLAGFHLWMVINFEVNWDEFFRLARVYEWKAGTLNAIFESNYIYGFRWLEHIHTNEVYQIIAARGVMYTLLVYTCIVLFLILKHFLDTTSGAITLISFLSFSFIFRHATSFRIDLPIISLLITVIWLTICSDRKLRHFFFAGLCLGIAGSISIKSIFYVPTIAIILLINWWQSKWQFKMFLNGLALGLTSICTFLILIYAHSQTLVQAESASGFISYASNAAILGHGFFPQKTTFFVSIYQNPLYWALLLIGLVINIHHVIKKQNHGWALISLSCLLPLISLVIYVHTYVYFYTYILAATSLLVGSGVYWLTTRYKLASLFLPLAFMISATSIFINSMKQTKDYQVQVNNVVHTMFPTSVNYIDRTSQISSFPKQGLFMTAVQVDEYKTRGVAVMESVFETTPPEFILANIDSLKLDQINDNNPSRRLMQQDENLLIDNFIHHWGPIYVPGKAVKGEVFVQEILIKLSGLYTIEAEFDVTINGTSHAPMTHLHFEKGPISLSTNANKSINLRWGKTLYKPDFEPLDDTIFHGF